MKHNNQHTIKKSYTKPVIEEVMIDREMSLIALSPPPTGGEGDIGEGGGMPTSINPDNYRTKIDYGSGTYKSARSPFSNNPEY